MCNVNSIYKSLYTNGSLVQFSYLVFFFFQAEDGIRDLTVTGVQTCALPIFLIGERAALAAGGHPRADRADRLRQAGGGLRRLLQQVKREPLRRLPSDPGELRQLRHEIFDSRHGGL